MGRALKKKVLELLQSEDLEQALEELHRMPPRQVVNPIFSLLHHSDQNIKWSAVIAMGRIVARLAGQDMEAARTIMRRLMWNLNDESGGIGWGSPEAIGEIMAGNGTLAEEYHQILISYTMPEGNYLEYEWLQRGLLWGIARLAQTRPHLLSNAVLHLPPYLESKDATVRAMAAWNMGLLRIESALPMLELLEKDHTPVQFFIGGKVTTKQVGELALRALEAIKRV
ncbi:DVU0298 family protein [Thermodesulfobacteriota bacterium]